MSKWIELGVTTDFPANQATQFKAEGIPLVVFNIEGAYLAIANVCPHAGLPLAEGELCGKVLTCPFHGYTYNVETGKNVDFPADEPVRTFPVRVSVEGKLEIDLQRKVRVSSNLQAALQQLAGDRDNALARTIELLSIPSISTNPAHADDVKRAAQWVVDHLKGSGFSVTAHETAGHPIVLAQRIDHGPDAPHILFYGHYDVQPPDPLELWESPPFKPVIKNGAIVARGAADDKGQICAFMEALRAWHKSSPTLPVNVTVLIEGEEECGGKNLPPFIHQHKETLSKANIIVVSDTSMWNRETPSITYSLRGLLYFDIQLHNSSRDLHSGTYGGTLANPNTIMTQVLGKLFDDQHRVTIPGFYDDVVPLGDDERKQWAALGFDDMRDYLTPIGVKTPFGEAGYSTLERRWSRPACDINGLYGGYGGPGAKTVIPSFSGAKVSFRLAPGQSHEKIAAAFERWLRSHNTHGCTWKLTNFGGCDAVLTNRQSSYAAAAKRALLKTAGKEPVLVRDGATIPVVGDFKRVLGLDTLMVGFGLEDDRIHSPNEKFDLYCFDLACKTHTTMLAEFAQKFDTE